MTRGVLASRGQRFRSHDRCIAGLSWWWRIAPGRFTSADVCRLYSLGVYCSSYPLMNYHRPWQLTIFEWKIIFQPLSSRVYVIELEGSYKGHCPCCWLIHRSCEIELVFFHGKLLNDVERTSIFWLVVWLPFFIFPYIGNFIIPIDELIFFRGVQTTNQNFNSYSTWKGSERIRL